MEKYKEAIMKFISKNDYLKRKDIIGIIFYGSYLNNQADNLSDIDLLIILNNETSKSYLRGMEEVDGYHIEYFEKSLSFIYEQINNDFNNRNISIYNIIGRGEIIYSPDNEKLEDLKKQVLRNYSQNLPFITLEDARHRLAILNNIMKELTRSYNRADFTLCYYNTLERIREFYHAVHAYPNITYSKAYRIYTNKEYRTSYGFNDFPDEEFLYLYLEAINDELNKKDKLSIIDQLFTYVKRDVDFNDNHHRFTVTPTKTK